MRNAFLLATVLGATGCASTLLAAAEVRASASGVGVDSIFYQSQGTQWADFHTGNNNVALNATAWAGPGGATVVADAAIIEPIYPDRYYYLASVRANADWGDNGIIRSSTLPIGTPVRIRLLLSAGIVDVAGNPWNTANTTCNLYAQGANGSSGSTAAWGSNDGSRGSQGPVVLDTYVGGPLNFSWSASAQADALFNWNGIAQPATSGHYSISISSNTKFQNIWFDAASGYKYPIMGSAGPKP